MNKKLLAAIFAAIPSLAFAHPSHDSGFAAAFAHPFTGLDHLLMMLCVGIFAGHIGGNARWQLPLAFLSAMTLGWLAAASGYFFAGVESGIAAGLIALGVLFVSRITLPRSLHIAVVAIFAFLHGMAHGAELSDSGVTAFGFLLATALLHGAGLSIAASIPCVKKNIYRAMGVLLMLIGGSFALVY